MAGNLEILGETNERSYDKIAEWFVNYRKSSEVDSYILWFIEKLNKGGRIFDVGSGGGVPNARFLVEKGFDVTGIDFSEQMIRLAKENVPAAKFYKADICAFETDEKYDGIVAWDSLFHLAYDKNEIAFEKLFGMLKGNGYMVFSHGGGQGEITGTMEGEDFSYSSLGPELTLATLEKIGFLIVKYEVDYSETNGYMKAVVRK
jgi:2-polyprenyl-3-methyl-5-hydroxy-6-metoxy-1,4-benzoquinol methylase